MGCMNRLPDLGSLLMCNPRISHLEPEVPVDPSCRLEDRETMIRYLHAGLAKILRYSILYQW
jgi:hypothetical protein